MALTINHQTNDISATSGSVTIDGAAAGGALNHISTQTITSSTASVTFSSVSGYDYYKIFFSGDLSTGGGQLRMTFFDGGTEVTTGYNTVYVRNGGDSTGTNVAYMFVSDFTSRSQIIAEISIGGNTSNPRIVSAFSGREGGNYIVGVSTGIQTASVTTLNGFKIFPGTGTIDAAKISLYGVSQS